MQLIDIDVLHGVEVDLKLVSKSSGNLEKGWSPEYKFKILLHDKKTEVGHIHFRIGRDEKIVNFIGHIGYGIDELHRGNQFAAKACNVLKILIKEHSMKNVILTCNPDNYASRKTFDNIGAKLIEIIDIPKTSSAYSETETQKCRYNWSV